MAKKKSSAVARGQAPPKRWPLQSLDYLLGEIGVAGPDDREGAVEAGNTSWPEGWYGVFDEMGGFIAYFEHEVDAFGFRLLLINTRLNLGEMARRYKEVDSKKRRG